ncbi:unnamed protein product [Rotaria sordida]|uniref:Uncharacterized protein n=1 Tax=Rotaria sordida TaxID=392033 RepID=A0A815U9I7_9BILA|nr:unnamed protein product [Rotaria sordida]
MSRKTFYRKRTRLQKWEQLKYDFITSKTSTVNQSQDIFKNQSESISSAPMKVEEIKEFKPERIESMDALATTTTEIINGKIKYYF